MDLDQLKQILDLVREHELSEFEVEQDGLRLKIRKDASGIHVPVHAVAAPVAPVVPASIPMPAAAAAAPISVGVTDVDIELAVVKSPIVGTFYRASEPAAPPFVEDGLSAAICH